MDAGHVKPSPVEVQFLRLNEGGTSPGCSTFSEDSTPSEIRLSRRSLGPLDLHIAQVAGLARLELHAGGEIAEES